MNNIRVAHMFAGGGGSILASEILAHESVLALELDPWRCRVLEGSGWFPKMEVVCGDIRDFDGSAWKGRVDCVSAGFPCQDISSAGKGAGIGGEKSGLVWSLLDAVDAIQPGIVFLENSPNIRTRGRREIIAWLVANGYAWRDGTLAAAAVGALHKRDRWWLIAANTYGARQLQQKGRICEEREWSRGSACGGGVEHLSKRDANTIQRAIKHTGRRGITPTDPDVCRVPYGLANRLDCRRIACLGNGQVPLQAAVAWRLLTN